MSPAALLALAAAAGAGATGAAAAAPLSFQAQASKAEVRLGEPFEVAIEVRHRKTEWYALPAAAALPGAPFHAEARGCLREERAEEAVTRCTLRLALFALGPHDVPEVGLLVTTPEGPATLAVPGPRLAGIGMLDPSAPPEALELRDLAPPVPLRVPSLRLVWWTLGLAGAAALALLALRAWRRRAARRAEPPPPLSPEERLARRLDDLAALRLGARGQGREHFFRLSETVREYLGARAALPALDLTSAEILERLQETGDPRIDLEALRAFLEGADLVKFARAPADQAACEEGLAFGRALLERLRPPPPPAGPARPEEQPR